MSTTQFFLTQSAQNPEYLSQAVQPFNANDFDAVQLGANTPSNFETPEKAAQTLAGLSRFAFRYAVTIGSVEEKTPIGELSLMDKNASKIHMAARVLHLDRLGIGDSKGRTLSGWYDSNAVTEDIESFSTELVVRIISMAKHLGLTSLEALVSSEKATKNPRLTVIEHTANLPGVGFEKVSDTSDMPDQGRTFTGSKWRIDL